MIKVSGFQNVQGTHNVTFKVLPLCTTSIPPLQLLWACKQDPGWLAGRGTTAGKHFSCVALGHCSSFLSFSSHVRKPQRFQPTWVVGGCVGTRGFLCGLHKILGWREEGGVGRLGGDRRRGGAPSARGGAQGAAESGFSARVSQARAAAGILPSPPSAAFVPRAKRSWGPATAPWHPGRTRAPSPCALAFATPPPPHLLCHRFFQEDRAGPAPAVAALHHLCAALRRPADARRDR